MHRHPQALEEGVGGVDGFIGNLHSRQRRVDAEDVHAVLDKARERAFVQDVPHPAGRDDGQALAVGDVVVAGEGVLDAVHRPAGTAVALGHDVVARQGAHEHHLGPGGVVLGVVDTGFSIDHQALDAGLAEAVVHEGGVFHEVLFQDVVDGIGHTGRRLVLGDAEGVARVQEGYFGVHEVRGVAQLVVGLGAGNDGAGIVLAARGRQGEDIHDGKGLQSRRLAGDEIPRIPVKARAARDGLGAVQNTAAAHGKDDLDAILLAQPRAFQHAGIVFRVGLDAGEFGDFEVFAQKVVDFLIQADFLDTSSAVSEEHFMAVSFEDLGELGDDALAENDARGGTIFEILHIRSFC